MFSYIYYEAGSAILVGEAGDKCFPSFFDGTWAVDSHPNHVERGEMIVELSEIVASAGCQNILRVLSHTREIGITRLVKAVNSTYNEVMRNARILEGEGIVRLIRVGRRCYVNLNYENVKTKILIEALKLLDSRRDFGQLDWALSA